MALPSEYSVAHAVTLVASGGHLVRPVDGNGTALDDGTTVYSVAHPVLETDAAGVVTTDATKIVSNPRSVTISAKGTPVVTVDSNGTVLGTTLGLGGGVLPALKFNVATNSMYSSLLV